MSKKIVMVLLTLFTSVSLLVGCGASVSDVENTTIQEDKNKDMIETKKDVDYSNLTEDGKLEIIMEMINTKQSSDDIVDACLSMYTKEENADNKAVVSVFLAHGYDEADKVAQKIYEDDNNKYLAMMVTLSKMKEEVASSGDTSTNNATNVKIGDFVYKVDGNYDYVKGDITNNGNRKIKYIEVVAKYRDANGKVIDSDWTNCTDIDAGDSAYYEIMHKHIEGTKSVEVKVNDVKFE